MKNKRDYIDRLDLWNNLPMHYPSVDDAILSAPTIDAVPVVRCKDCKYYKSPVVIRDSGICAFANRDELTEPADYCSRGAKMDGKDGDDK